MADESCFYFADVVVLRGWPAYALARLLARHCGEPVAELPPHLRQPIEDAVAALTLAGNAWASSARGSAQADAAEAVASSNHGDALTTAEAADLLNLTPRRVRQLAQDGSLPGRQIGGRWTFRRRDVDDYVQGEI